MREPGASQASRGNQRHREIILNGGWPTIINKTIYVYPPNAVYVATGAHQQWRSYIRAYTGLGPGKLSWCPAKSSRSIFNAGGWSLANNSYYAATLLQIGTGTGIAYWFTCSCRM